MSDVAVVSFVFCSTVRYGRRKKSILSAMRCAFASLGSDNRLSSFQWRRKSFRLWAKSCGAKLYDDDHDFVVVDNSVIVVVVVG